jgi:hypothetical protein
VFQHQLDKDIRRLPANKQSNYNRDMPQLNIKWQAPIMTPGPYIGHPGYHQQMKDLIQSKPYNLILPVRFPYINAQVCHTNHQRTPPEADIP